MKKFSLWMAIATLAVSQACFAAPDQSADESVAEASYTDLKGEERSSTIERIEAYLSGLNSVVAKFTQASSDGSTGTGQFYLKRPGKMRWQYDPPTPLLLVSDGKTITYVDAGLDQATYISMDDTLASFLIKKDIALDSPITRLTSFTKGSDGSIRATLIHRKKPEEGKLILEFGDKPLILRRMIATDATGIETKVDLSGAEFGTALDDKLFTYTDPRGVNYKRNKKKI